MATTQCSECDEEIEIAGRTRLGQKIVCNHCGAQLEVVATTPLEVAPAQEEDDDLWDDDEFEDDELDDETLDDDGDDFDDLDDELEIEDEFEDEDLDDLEEFEDEDDDKWS
jgi:lysine biosynthesis protein LysW